MANPVFNVCIDWDCPDWAGPHDFTGDDITDDVKHFRITRGKDRDVNTYPAATLEMLLENSDGTYTPTLNAKVRLWLPVRVQATYGGTTYSLYYGYLNRIAVYPIKSRQDIYFYATDGIDLLAKTIVVQDMDDKALMTDGAAVHRVLNAASWNSTRACTMQNAGDTVTDSDHGLQNGDIVMFSGSGIPAAIDTHTQYFVAWKTDHTFLVSTTADGLSLVEFAGDGSGYYHVILRRAIDLDGGDITYFPDTFEFSKS